MVADLQLPGWLEQVARRVAQYDEAPPIHTWVTSYHFGVERTETSLMIVSVVDTSDEGIIDDFGGDGGTRSS